MKCQTCPAILTQENTSTTWKKRCKQCHASYMRAYRRTDKGRAVTRQSQVTYKNQHRSKIVEYRRSYRRLNADRLRAYHREYIRNYRATNPNESLKTLARLIVYHATRLAIVGSTVIVKTTAIRSPTFHSPSLNSDAGGLLTDCEPIISPLADALSAGRIRECST